MPVDFTGTWRNQLNSRLELQALNGVLTGRFESGVGDDGQTIWVPITGRYLDDVMAFITVYERYQTIVSWVGQHTEGDGRGMIKTHWIHATNIPDQQEEAWMWFSNRIGSDIFTRV